MGERRVDQVTKVVQKRVKLEFYGSGSRKNPSVKLEFHQPCLKEKKDEKEKQISPSNHPKGRRENTD